MAVCPTCGRPGYEPARKIVTADDLIAAMRQLGKDHKSRDVYRGGRGYWLTYGHEAVARNAVYEALRRGLIAPTYPHIEDGYWSLTRSRGRTPSGMGGIGGQARGAAKGFP